MSQDEAPKCIEKCGRDRQRTHGFYKNAPKYFPRCRDKEFGDEGVDWVPCEKCNMPVSINGCWCTADDEHPPEGPLRAEIKKLRARADEREYSFHIGSGDTRARLLMNEAGEMRLYLTARSNEVETLVARDQQVFELIEKINQVLKIDSASRSGNA